VVIQDLSRSLGDTGTAAASVASRATGSLRLRGLEAIRGAEERRATTDASTAPVKLDYEIRSEGR